MRIVKGVLSYFWPLMAVVNKVKQWLYGRGIINILIYHDIPVEQQGAFAEQIKWLKQCYEVITPAQFNQYLRAGHIPRGIKILITFDDGFQSNCAICERVLNSLGIKAIFFVLPDLIMATSEVAKQIIKQRVLDGASSFHYSKSDLKAMNVADIQSLINHGHIIGSHTRTHARLSMLSDEQLHDEIIGSADQLEKLFNINVRHFAYPFGAVGDINKKAMQLACQRYDYVHSGVRGANVGSAKIKVIFRDEVSPMYSKRYLHFIIEGGLSFYYWKARQELKKMASSA